MQPEPIYLDYNATTPLDPHVQKVMGEAMAGVYGNPSSLHSVGAKARKVLEETREKVADYLKVAPDEIIFTSGGTESNNLALRGILQKFLQKFKDKKKHVISTQVEHKSVLDTLQKLAEENIIDLTLVGVDALGRLSSEEISKAIRPETVLISVMWVNNETGNIHPIAEIGALARSKKIIFHVDAVQALGKLPIDLSTLPIDAMSVSAHKIYGPKGVGALFLRNGTPLKTLTTGGAQEMEKRGGTENVIGIKGFGEAISLLSQREAEAASIEILRNRLQKGLEKIQGALVRGDINHRVPHTLNMTFEGMDSEMSVIAMDRAGIAVSSGSACASGAIEPSHVLLAMGVDKKLSRGALRFSLGRFTTEKEIDRVVAQVPLIVEGLRK